MLTEDLKQEIQDAYRQFLAAKSLRPRTGQRLMIAHIARMLGGIKRNQEFLRSGGDHLCAIEAGTGTGKTLAYCLAAIPVAKALDKTLVVATATVALQEQILFRDLPDILEHSGLDFSVSLAKGRRRYLCLSKLDQHLSGGDAQTLPLLNLDDVKTTPDAANLGLYTQFADQLASGSWNGDRDAWGSVIDDQSWARVTTDHAQCTGRRCAHVKQCSFFKARESLGQADVVVANHDLVLADLALGGGAILPAPEDSIYVFDEAHHLPDKVINHFSANLRLGATERWFDQAERSLAGIISLPSVDVGLRGPMETLMGLLSQSRKGLAPLRPQLEALLEGDSEGPNPRCRFADGVVPDELASLSRDLKRLFGEVVNQAEQLVDKVQEGLDKNHFKAPREDIEQWLATLSAIRYRCEAGLMLWRSYASDASQEKPPHARWLAMVDAGQGMLDIELNASPILAANALRQALWSRCYGAVMTSATLTALGNFNRFSMRAGLASDTSFEVVPSPFAHGEAGELVVPKMECDAGDAQAHTEALIVMLPRLINPDEGTLVLFASRKQMRAVFDGLPRQWQQRILAQDSLPKHEILSQHRQRVDGGEGSIIFGLASFAEGVDLPGDYCRHVVIAKIPFAVPEDPVEEALAEWISRNNGNPFMEITVPDAAVRLVQASGRLLRKESDTGRITILDRRIVTRHYGRRILASMPPYRQIID